MEKRSRRRIRDLENLLASNGPDTEVQDQSLHRSHRACKHSGLSHSWPLVNLTVQRASRFGALIGKFVRRPDDKDLEHQHWVGRWPPAFRPIRVGERRI